MSNVREFYTLSFCAHNFIKVEFLFHVRGGSFMEVAELWPPNNFVFSVIGIATKI